MNRLKEYNLKLTYHSSRNQHIEIADELSRMFTKLMFIIRTHDEKRLMMMTFIQKSDQQHRLHTSSIDILISTENSRIDKYRSLLMYERLVKFLQKEVFALEELDRNRR